jgi:uncharacterized protein
MPPDWSRPADIERLADLEERREFRAALSEFPRLAGQLAGEGGYAEGRIEVMRRSGVPVAHVIVHAEVPLVCQRCMRPVTLDVSGDSWVALVADFEGADRAPAGLESVLAEGGRVVLRDLAEEEVLLALPLVPRHGMEGDAAGDDGHACSAFDAAPAAQVLELPPTGTLADEEFEEVTQKPFAELGELLKRGR